MLKKLSLIALAFQLSMVHIGAEPWGSQLITVTAGTAQRLNARPGTLATSLFTQMATGGTGRGYLLFAQKGTTCSKGGAGTILIAELAPATSTAPGSQPVVIPFPNNPQNPKVDISLYCWDGSNSGDGINISWNLSN